MLQGAHRLIFLEGNVMKSEMNKQKVLGELLNVKFLIAGEQRKPQYRRYSPATKEVFAMLLTAVEACAEAVRNGHPLMFEINVWEQQSLSGWAINLADSENPIQIE